jgi:hypothetical protein
MLTPRANIHRSKLPRLGAIVTVQIRPLSPALNVWGHQKDRYRRYIVEAFPLSDSADLRYSRGIHTVYLRALDNGERARVSGHWCVEEGQYE